MVEQDEFIQEEDEEEIYPQPPENMHVNNEKKEEDISSAVYGCLITGTVCASVSMLVLCVYQRSYDVSFYPSSSSLSSGAESAILEAGFGRLK